MSKKFFLGFLSIFVIATSIFFTNSASAKNDAENLVQSPATSLLIEDFTADPGTAITTTTWTAHSAGGTNPIVTSAPGLTLTGYPSSGIGNAVALATSGEDVNRPFAIQSSGSVYAAFMVNTSEASTDAAGGYFFHLGPDPVGTTFRGRVFIKKDASNNVAFGISKAATAAVDIAYTPFVYSLNTTYLVVVKYTIVDGATNDTVAMFVSTTVPGTEPSPTATATDVSATDVNIGTVSLRQGAVATSPTVRVDGIRVGTTWASVTQPVAPPKSPIDFDADGKTDFSVVQNFFSGGPYIWYNQLNASAQTNGYAWGTGVDTITPADFDGDGKTDIAVWRPAPPNQAQFYILNSSNNTLRIEIFGQTGDAATIVRDYDGDGKADPATFRPSAGTFFYRGSLNNPSGNITYVPFGAPGDYSVPGDFDGDGKGDFCVQRDNGGAGQFILLKSSGGVEFFNWGLTNDVIVPGDYDGDGKTDFGLIRPNMSATLDWYILTRTGSVIYRNWGNFTGNVLTTDIPAVGDYDGDGKTDITVWRPGTGAIFYILQSTNNAVRYVPWGKTGDVPAASYTFRSRGFNISG